MPSATPRYTSPKGISQEVNVIVWLEFELSYNVVAAQYVTHCTTGTFRIYNQLLSPILQ